MKWYVLLVKVWANRNIDDIGGPSNTTSEYIPQRKFSIGLHEDIYKDINCSAGIEGNQSAYY